MRFQNRLMTITTVTIFLTHINSAEAQKLLLYYDFEGNSAASIEDVSGYVDASGMVTPANGTLVDPDGTPNNAVIVADMVDPGGRGDVLKTGDSGYGATIPYARKMDFRNSFTLSAWIRTADTLAVWQEVAGRDNGGPRFFNHWGLGSVGGAEFYNVEFGLDLGFSSDPVQFVSPTGFVDGTQWHHLLLTWNAAEQQLWGYYDGFDGGDPDDVGLSPRDTLGDLLVAHPGEAFIIGEPRNDPPPPNPHPDLFVDDVAYWQGYAPPNVATGLFDGTIAIADVADMLEVPTQSADFDGDNVVDGADFLKFQHNFGLDDLNNGVVTVADGDGDGDLKVDGFDLEVWEDEFGTGIPLLTTATTIPEPLSCQIMIAALVALVISGRRLRCP